MKEDARDPVEVLRKELELLSNGHYERLSLGRWRPGLIFEDSPSCLNYQNPTQRGQCDDCILMQFVPDEKRRERIPCRHIALTPEGETLDCLYRSCEMEKVYQATKDWLCRTIEALEQERDIYDQSGRSLLGMDSDCRAVALYESAEPKCANPGCSSAFHWSAQGKLFRFPVGRKQLPAGGVHQVRHYWLCEGCRQQYILTGDPVWGAIVRPLPLPSSTQELRKPEVDQLWPR
jgi:hypothetical protein